VLTGLRAAAQDKNPRVAVEGLYALGALSDNAYGTQRHALLSAAAEELAPLVGVPRTDIRGTAVRVIGRMYSWRVGDPAVDERIGDAVVNALNDANYDIRLAALDVLGGLRYDRGVQSLTDIYQHYQRGPLAVAALTALARIAHPSTRPLFVAALDGRDVALRAAATAGLARSGATDQLDRIHELLANERNEEAQLAGHFADALLADGAVDDLVGGLARQRTRPQALRYLIDVGPGRAHLLGPHVEDPQPALRIDLLEVLGLSGDPVALSTAERSRQDPDPAVSRAAARALLRLQGSAPVQ
jgi:HEAT repeat protein